MLRIEKREHWPARQKQHPSPQFLRGTESAGSSSAGASHGSLDGRKSVLPAAVLWVGCGLWVETAHHIARTRPCSGRAYRERLAGYRVAAS